MLENEKAQFLLFFFAPGVEILSTNKSMATEKYKILNNLAYRMSDKPSKLRG